MNDKEQGSLKKICKICGKPIEVTHYVLGKKHTHPCACQCMIKELELNEAYRRAGRDANSKAVPVVMYRHRRKPWLVVMKLSDWLSLIKGGQ
jgi:hypothetical protein